MMFQNMYKNLKASPVDNDISSSENNKQEKTPKISMGIAEAEKTKKPKTKSGIIAVIALVLIVVGVLYYSGFFSNEGQRRRVSINSTSSATEASEYYSVGEKAYKEKNYQKAFENFTKAAELGNGKAQFYLTRMYHESEGIEKNLERVFYWMNKAYTTKPSYRNKFMCGNQRERRNLHIHRGVSGSHYRNFIARDDNLCLNACGSYVC